MHTSSGVSFLVDVHFKAEILEIFSLLCNFSVVYYVNLLVTKTFAKTGTSSHRKNLKTESIIFWHLGLETRILLQVKRIALYFRSTFGL